MSRTATTPGIGPSPHAGPRIRRARGSDAPALSALAFHSKAFWGYDDAFMAACREELSYTARDLTGSLVYVIEEAGGPPLGFYQLKLEGDTAEVWAFFVEPAAIGRGHGGRLWRHLVATARRRAAARLGVDSDPNAEGFYLKMGLRRCGEAASLSIPGRLLPRLEIDL